MKFKSSDGKIFDSIEDAVNFYCNQYKGCTDCALLEFPCHHAVWVKQNPLKIAQLIGYKVIEEEEIDMDKEKKLEDYTIKEVKKYCSQQESCENCKFHVAGNCIFNSDPNEWAIPSPWTDDEIALARILLHIGAKEIKRQTLDANTVCFIDSQGKEHYMSELLFPSLVRGESYLLEDIVNDGEINT